MVAQETAGEAQLQRFGLYCSKLMTGVGIITQAKVHLIPLQVDGRNNGTTRAVPASGIQETIRAKWKTNGAANHQLTDVQLPHIKY